MIVSVNSDPNRSEFDLLLGSTISELNVHAKKSSKKVETLLGRNLEPYVRDVMTDLAVGTVFENSIELIGGQKFPDIVAKKYMELRLKPQLKTIGKLQEIVFLKEQELTVLSVFLCCSQS